MKYGIEIGWRESDPTTGVRTFKATEIHTWTEDEIAKFETYWALGTRERLAFDLLLYSGQRISDVARMARPAAGEKIRVRQQKTKTELVIAVHPDLPRSLDACPSGQLTAIVTAHGTPFSIKGFGNFVSDAIREAGLPEVCKAHGLRKAAARRLAEAGCTAHEIASVTGHRTLGEVERYARKASQEMMNAAAMAKQGGEQTIGKLRNTEWQTHCNCREKKATGGGYSRYRTCLSIQISLQTGKFTGNIAWEALWTDGSGPKIN